MNEINPIASRIVFEAPTLENSLAMALLETAAMRNQVDEETRRLNAMLQAVKDSEEYKAAELRRQHFSESLAAAEARAKAVALDVFRATGVKSRVGVSVKHYTTTTLDYDYAAAYKWAETSAKELIILDRKLFESYAKAVANITPVPCVKMITTEEDRPQLDSILDNLAELGQAKGKK